MHSRLHDERPTRQALRFLQVAIRGFSKLHHSQPTLCSACTPHKHCQEVVCSLIDCSQRIGYITMKVFHLATAFITIAAASAEEEVSGAALFPRHA